jgi:hypothetical protein
VARRLRICRLRSKPNCADFVVGVIWMSEQVAFGARVILMIEGAGAIDHGLGSKACFALVACVGKPRGCRVLSRVVCLSIFTLVALYYSR